MRRARLAACAGLATSALMITVPRAALAGNELATPPRTSPVAGGQDAVSCAWPTTVAVTDSGGLCSGALIHPRVVSFAAHCGDQGKRIKFGESSVTPGKMVEPEFCLANPDYLGTSDQAHDWAFCVLREPVDLPVSPPLFGCETDILEDGLEVAIVGFGKNTDAGGSGTKRWAMTTINSVFGNTVAIGSGGVGTCEGDSGGSAYVKLADGTWRAFSMVSTGVGCGGGGVHSLLEGAVPWIEEHADVDITQCHDQDGTWAPTAGCGGFFAGGEMGYGAWAQWCDGTPAGDMAATCGDPFDASKDTDAPTVMVTAPTDGTRFDGAPADVDIAIDADDGDGYGVKEVRVEINGMEQPLVDDHAPYLFAAAQFPKGVFEIVGIAEDHSGNIGRSEPIHFGVDEDPPGGTSGGDGGTGHGTDTAGDDTTDGPGETGGPETSGTSGGQDGGTGDSKGCSCRASERRSVPWALITMVGIGLARRRWP